MSLLTLLPQPLPAPPETKLGVHSVNWWGDPKHPDAGFKSDDPLVVSHHMDLMIGEGFQYNIMNWRGASQNPTQHRAVGAWIAEAQRRGIASPMSAPFKIAVQIDVGMFPLASNATTELLNQMTAVRHWFDSPAYLDNLALEFGTEAVSIDWSLVKASFPKLKFLFRHRDFLWVEMPQSGKNSIDILKARYAQNPAPIMGAAFWQFDDAWPLDRSKSVWPSKPLAIRPPARWIPHNFGRLWFDSFAAAPQGLPYLTVSTWDDFEEGTAIAHLIAMLQGERL